MSRGSDSRDRVSDRVHSVMFCSPTTRNTKIMMPIVIMMRAGATNDQPLDREVKIIKQCV